jgi:hypothetical protein
VRGGRERGREARVPERRAREVAGIAAGGDDHRRRVAAAGRQCPVERRRGDHPLLPEAFAEACDLRAVHQRAPVPVGRTFTDVELDRIGAGVDDRVAFRFIVDQGRQAAGIAGVRIAA